MKKFIFLPLIILLLPACRDNDKRLLRLAEKIHEKTMISVIHQLTQMVLSIMASPFLAKKWSKK